MESTKSWVEIGKVLREWGLKGELKIVLFNPESDLPSQVSQFYFNLDGQYRLLTLVAAKRHGEFWRIKIKDLETPELAKGYRGVAIALPREDLPELEPGEIYLTDLVGLKVEGPDQKLMGNVIEIQQVGESDILWIETPEGKQVPIPYESDFIASTQMNDQKILLTEMALELFTINQS